MIIRNANSSAEVFPKVLSSL